MVDKTRNNHAKVIDLQLKKHQLEYEGWPDGWPDVGDKVEELAEDIRQFYNIEDS